jgi:valyl-tRNA synthetase
VQPVMPFVAESVWQALNEIAPTRGIPEPSPAAKSVCIASWPGYPAEWRDETVERRFARVQDLVRSIREIRARYSVDPKTLLDVHVRCSDQIAGELKPLEAFVRQLAGIGTLEIGPTATKPPQAASAVHADLEASVSLAGLIDVEKEKARLIKQIAEKRKHLQGMHAKLANEGFMSRAPAEVVQQHREQMAETENQMRALEANLRELRVL